MQELEVGQHPRRRGVHWRVAPGVLAALVAAGGLTGTAGASESDAGPAVAVIVRETPNAGDRPEAAVLRLGGEVGLHIDLIDAFAATLPATALDSLEATGGVASVTPNAPVELSGSYDGFDPSNDEGSMYKITGEVTGAGEYWDKGFTGQGVDVALLDTGVVPVNGLTTPGKVVHGPDLSFESQSSDRVNLDTYGHGTHMAGIIAGRDDATPLPVRKGDSTHFVGMAPGARIVSVKVADAHGATDVSQVLAGIDWIVQHRNTDGLNIRVLNLSFGTDGVQDYRFDPLTYAAEVAWRKGIVVVVAAGNRGDSSAKLDNPAYDPYVLAVGGADDRGTHSVSDDVVGDFSSRGDATRAPDLVAPGTSIVSLRAPGSAADLDHPEGRVGTRQFRGTGTSQAAAVVSGAAALVIGQRPAITPDQVKALLTRSAQQLPATEIRAQGAGMLDLKKARTEPTPVAVQTWAPALGTGSLDASRGSADLEADGVVLTGEQDIHGRAFDSAAWAATSLAGTSFAGGPCNGNRWSGNRWSGNRWSGNRWSGNRWSGNRWSGDSWAGNRWSGNRWSGNRWSGNRWSGNRWSGDSWAGNRWSGNRWSGDSWSSFSAG